MRGTCLHFPHSSSSHSPVLTFFGIHSIGVEASFFPFQSETQPIPSFFFDCPMVIKHEWLDLKVFLAGIKCISNNQVRDYYKQLVQPEQGKEFNYRTQKRAIYARHHPCWPLDSNKNVLAGKAPLELPAKLQKIKYHFCFHGLLKLHDSYVYIWVLSLWQQFMAFHAPVRMAESPTICCIFHPTRCTCLHQKAKFCASYRTEGAENKNDFPGRQHRKALFRSWC